MRVSAARVDSSIVDIPWAAAAAANWLSYSSSRALQPAYSGGNVTECNGYD